MFNLLLAALVLLMSTTIPISPLSNNEEKVIALKEELDVEEKELTEDEVIHKMLQKEYEKNKQFSDVAGVLYMEDYILDVVMRPIEEDPERYLYASRDGEYLREGELFFSDATNHTDDEIDLNMARIYGHNMATGRKFGLLKRLLNKENERDLYYYDAYQDRTVKFNPVRSFKFIDGTEMFERHDLEGQDRIDFLSKVSQPYMAGFRDLSEIEDDKDVLILQTCESAWGLRRDVVIFVEEAVIQ